MLLAKIVNILKFVLELGGISATGATLQLIISSLNQAVGLLIGLVTLVGAFMKVRKEFKKDKSPPSF